MAERILSRRNLLRFFGIATGGMAVKPCLWPYRATAQDPPRANTVAPFTGPEPNSHWNSVGPYFTEPQKARLLLLTDRPVQLETPRHYFLTPFTPNEAFYVRWHLEGIPNAVDLKEWKLRIEGDVKKPIALSMSDLIQKFKPISIAAVNQCSGNSRSRDGLSKIPAGMSVTLRGIAFSGFGGVVCARKFQTMEERPGRGDSGRRPWPVLLSRLGDAVDPEVARPLFSGGARYRPKK